MPSALQVEFGDFVTFRMDEVVAVQYNGGFGRAPKVRGSPPTSAPHSVERGRSPPLCPSLCKLMDTAGREAGATGRLHPALTLPAASTLQTLAPQSAVYPVAMINGLFMAALETDSTDTAQYLPHADHCTATGRDSA